MSFVRSNLKYVRNTGTSSIELPALTLSYKLHMVDVLPYADILCNDNVAITLWQLEFWLMLVACMLYSKTTAAFRECRVCQCRQWYGGNPGKFSIQMCVCHLLSTLSLELTLSFFVHHHALFVALKPSVMSRPLVQFRLAALTQLPQIQPLADIRYYMIWYIICTGKLTGKLPV